MAYKPETLRKVSADLKAKIDKYMQEEEIRICISAGNVKIGRVMNVSLAPIWTCPNCSGCSRLCYDIKACLQYENVRDARARNTALMQKNRDLYFALIDKAMSRRRKNKYFRWHVAGDIVDIDYFDRMIKNARLHPDFVIWTYTKNYFAVNKWIRQNGIESIPANFHVMFSEWRGMPMVNPYHMPEFRVVFHDDAEKPDPAKVHYCPGNCDVCKKTGRGCIAGETTYCHEH